MLQLIRFLLANDTSNILVICHIDEGWEEINIFSALSQRKGSLLFLGAYAVSWEFCKVDLHAFGKQRAQHFGDVSHP